MIIVDQFMNENYGIVIQNDLNMINEQYNNHLLSESQFSSKIKLVLGKIKEFIIKGFNTLKEKIKLIINKIKSLFKKSKSKDKNKSSNSKSVNAQFNNDDNIIKGYNININFDIYKYSNNIKEILDIWDYSHNKISIIVNDILESKEREDYILEDLNSLTNDLKNKYKEALNINQNTNFDEIKEIIKFDKNGETKISEVELFLNKLINVYDEIINTSNPLKKKILDSISELSLHTPMMLNIDITHKNNELDKKILNGVELLCNNIKNYYNLTSDYIFKFCSSININVIENLKTIIENRKR